MAVFRLKLSACWSNDGTFEDFRSHDSKTSDGEDEEEDNNEEDDVDDEHWLELKPHSAR